MATRKKPGIDLFVNSGQESGFDPYGYNGFPDYVQEMNEAPYLLSITISSKEDMERFAKLVDEPQLVEDGKRTTKSIWYPKLERGERGSNGSYVWIEE